MKPARVNPRAFFISMLLFGITMYIVFRGLVESHPYNGFAGMTGFMIGLAIACISYELLRKALAKTTPRR